MGVSSILASCPQLAVTMSSSLKHWSHPLFCKCVALAIPANGTCGPHPVAAAAAAAVHILSIDVLFCVASCYVVLCYVVPNVAASVQV